MASYVGVNHLLVRQNRLDALRRLAIDVVVGRHLSQ